MTDEKVPEAAALDTIRDEREQKAIERKAKNVAAREALLDDMDEVEKLLVVGDVGKIATNSDLRVRYVAQRHYRLGIPFTPGAIIFITTDGKIIPYHTAVCASAIRAVKGWTSKILSTEQIGAVYVITMRVYDPKEPDHFADNIGALPLRDSGGQDLNPSEIASNMKKCLTQAERRATFSLAGIAGDDPREDGGPIGWYPEQTLNELKVIEPKARLVTSTTVQAGVVVVDELPTAPATAPPAAAPAAKKRRVVRRADGSVVPQPQPQGVDPAEAAPTMPTEPPTKGPGASGNAEGGPGGVKGQAEPAKAPEAPRPAASEPAAVACTHPALLKLGKPGHTYACPPPPDGCGELVTMPGERLDKPTAPAQTTPMPVRPRAVRLVKRVVPR